MSGMDNDGAYGDRPLTFRDLQRQHAEWDAANFDPRPDNDMGAFLGIVEELGELAHAILKARHGASAVLAELRARERDALGDVMVFLASFAEHRGHDLQEIVEATWAEVRCRDYRKYPTDGRTR